jgi:CO dehydrogenase/acetyl-CoA synthase alpha subunit
MQTIPGQGQGLFLEAQKTSGFSGKFCIIDSSNQKVINMTDDELRALVGSLATATARNTESIDRINQTVDRNALTVDNLRESIQIQAQTIENIREGISYNTQILSDGLELAAASNRTAAAAMELSANTARAIDQLRNEIADLKQIVGIVINDSRADRSRIRNLEDQD